MRQPGSLLAALQSLPLVAAIAVFLEGVAFRHAPIA